MNEKVLNHPLITHKLALLRDVGTGTKVFRELVTEISIFVMYEAMRDAKLEETTIETPLEKMETGMLNEDHYAVVPILRAGMGMVDGILNVIPNAKIGHIGLYRDEKTFEPVEYYYKTKDEAKESQIEQTLLDDGWLFEKSEDIYLDEEDVFLIYYYITKGANHNG